MNEKGYVLPVAADMQRCTAFIEILSQCPTHFKQSPVQMFRAFQEQTVAVKKMHTEEGAGKIGVGEFQDIQRPDWISSYRIEYLRLKI